MTQSPWQEFFRDSELLDVIKLDLSRTYPDLEFFQSEQTQRQMLHILFVWSKLNANTSYRQGMNELLAPLLLLVAAEAIPQAQVSAPVPYPEPDALVQVCVIYCSTIRILCSIHLIYFSVFTHNFCNFIAPAGRRRPVRLVCVRAQRALH